MRTHGTWAVVVLALVLVGAPGAGARDVPRTEPTPGAGVREAPRPEPVPPGVSAPRFLSVDQPTVPGPAYAHAASTAGTLHYEGGVVLHSSAPYLVFWTPPGESIPASSERSIQQFLTDAAADSGKASNMFGVLRQYHDAVGFADYRQTFNPAHQVIVDTHAYPPEDHALCPDVSVAYPTCLSDQQIQSELERLKSANGLPSWLSGQPSTVAPVYFVILPADVATCEVSGTLCTGTQNCAYHQFDLFQSILWSALALEPYRDLSNSVVPKGVCQGDGTSVVQAPGGDGYADVLIGLLSHEYSETITDPIYSTGWFAPGVGGLDTAGQEIGDECEATGPFSPATGTNPDAFLPTLGGAAAAGTLFTQQINGHAYYTQSEWSNGVGNCAMRPSPGVIVPRFTVPPRVSAGIPLGLSPAGSSSTHGYSSATWSFGDGTTPGFFSGGQALTATRHIYRTAGIYTVTLTLVDAVGNLQAVTKRVTVGTARCVVPNVEGKSLSSARAAILAADCAVGKVSTPRKPTRHPGKNKRWRLVVGRESPAPGSVRRKGAKVSLGLIYRAVRA